MAPHMGPWGWVGKWGQERKDRDDRAKGRKNAGALHAGGVAIFLCYAPVKGVVLYVPLPLGYDSPYGKYIVRPV